MRDLGSDDGDEKYAERWSATVTIKACLYRWSLPVYYNLDWRVAVFRRHVGAECGVDCGQGRTDSVFIIRRVDAT